VVDDIDAAERWVCSLSDRHGGDHYLLRANLPARASRVPPVAPDAERDARRARYSLRQRNDARRALDRFLGLLNDDGDPTDDDYVELVVTLGLFMSWATHGEPWSLRDGSVAGLRAREDRGPSDEDLLASFDSAKLSIHRDAAARRIQLTRPGMTIGEAIADIRRGPIAESD
jgi:hypothetical protein